MTQVNKLGMTLEQIAKLDAIEGALYKLLEEVKLSNGDDPILDTNHKSLGQAWSNIYNYVRDYKRNAALRASPLYKEFYSEG